MLQNTTKFRADDIDLEADVDLAPHSRGLVLFVHGSGSSRRSSRNRYVAQSLRKHGLGTVLMDLLTAEEARVDAVTATVRFDIALLSRRVIAVIDQLHDKSPLPLGLFGASTGAAAALVAAAARADDIAAVVSRGGRPDLAGRALPNVAAPTLLVVGSADPDVLTLNRHAMSQMRAETRLEIIAGASHLFEEPGALEQVAALAGTWFETHLATSRV